MASRPKAGAAATRPQVACCGGATVTPHDIAVGLEPTIPGVAVVGPESAGVVGPKRSGENSVAEIIARGVIASEAGVPSLVTNPVT
jgi:hypothetical protein